MDPQVLESVLRLVASHVPAHLQETMKESFAQIFQPPPADDPLEPLSKEVEDRLARDWNQMFAESREKRRQIETAMRTSVRSSMGTFLRTLADTVKPYDPEFAEILSTRAYDPVAVKDTFLALKHQLVDVMDPAIRKMVESAIQNKTLRGFEAARKLFSQAHYPAPPPDLPSDGVEHFLTNVSTLIMIIHAVMKRYEEGTQRVEAVDNEHVRRIFSEMPKTTRERVLFLKVLQKMPGNGALKPKLDELGKAFPHVSDLLKQSSE